MQLKQLILEMESQEKDVYNREAKQTAVSNSVVYNNKGVEIDALFEDGTVNFVLHFNKHSEVDIETSSITATDVDSVEIKKNSLDLKKIKELLDTKMQEQIDELDEYEEVNDEIDLTDIKIPTK